MSFVCTTQIRSTYLELGHPTLRLNLQSVINLKRNVSATLYKTDLMPTANCMISKSLSVRSNDITTFIYYYEAEHIRLISETLRSYKGCDTLRALTVNTLLLSLPPCHRRQPL